MVVDGDRPAIRQHHGGCGVACGASVVLRAVVVMEFDTPEHWTAAQISVFTRTCRFMAQNQFAFHHPGAPLLSVEHWQTVCHNAAWIAAEFLECETLAILDEDAVFAASMAGLNS